MKIYLDDERSVPDGWILVKTAPEAIKMLQTEQVEVISLDHDLGESECGTGYDVLLWIEEQVALFEYIPPEIKLHTANASARIKMELAISKINEIRMGQSMTDSKYLEFRTYCKKAHDILHRDTGYSRNKDLITSAFKQFENNSLDRIQYRLAIIDSFYSTQMNKRLYGIEDIATEIHKLSLTDEQLCEQCQEFLCGSSNGNIISVLFNKSYGINKLGKDYGLAVSLISKYLYFLTDYKFPIYDKLAKKSYKVINRYFQIDLPKIKAKFEIKYFYQMRQLSEETGVNSYDNIDNYLWLFGKIMEGSYSLILTKERYLILLQGVDKSQKLSSVQINRVIKETIKSNEVIIKKIFEDDEIDFIKHTNSVISVTQNKH